MNNIPKKIKVAIILIYASLIAELISCYLYYKLTPEGALGGNISLNFLLIGFAVNLFLAFNIIKKQNWARIILLVFYSLDIIIYSSHISKFFFWELSIGIISVIIKLLQLSILIILFSGTSQKWFNVKNNLDESNNSNM